MSNPAKKPGFHLPALGRRALRSLGWEISYWVIRALHLVIDLVKMVDVNDFGRYISKNLSRRFIALSGIVTLFAFVGNYITRLVFGETTQSVPTDNLLETLVANFLFFGVPGGILLLTTQLFCFFNRSNYFTAQANYLNLVEAYKRCPARIEKVIDKLWEHIYRQEYEVYARKRSHPSMCARVEQIQRQKSEEMARLIRACTQGQDLEAREKYEERLKGARGEGYIRQKRWEALTHPERCRAVEDLIEEETVAAITGEDLVYCERGFKFNADWALHSPIHLNVKHDRCGIDLKLIEDWMDGAFFDLTDTKLIEQYIAEATIKSVKIQARVPLIPFILFQGIRTFFQRVWTHMVFGITSKRLGRYLNHLNHHYVREESDLFDRDFFKAEAFFWPTQAYDRQIESQVGLEALRRLKALRKRWLSITLGKVRLPRVTARTPLKEALRQLDGNTARAMKGATRMVHRMFAGSLYNIHELRLRYDPDYVMEILERERETIEGMGFDMHYFVQQRRRVAKKQQEIVAFRQLLPSLLEGDAMARHGLKRPMDLEGERAIRVAYHIDEYGLKRWVKKERVQGHPAARERICSICARVANRRRSYSRKIRQLKIFETLAIHHLKIYIRALHAMYETVGDDFREAVAAKKEGPDA